MARQRVRTTTTTTRTRQRKTGGDSGYVKCNVCGGTGRHKKGKRKKG